MVKPPAASPSEPGDQDRLLDQFEEAWRNDPPPTLEQFVPPAPGKPMEEGARCELLRELIRIDLDHRWRRRRPGDGRLENYLLRYPELRCRKSVLLELIAEEFRARRRWGDCPQAREYAGRFPECQPNLEELLARVDAELRAELAQEGRRVSFGLLAEPAAPSRGALMTQPVKTSPDLVQLLRQCRLVDPALATDAVLAGLCQSWPEPRSLAKELLQRGWLTPFQVNQLLRGNAAELAIGPYVLVERLGQGGGGQVFKARHLHMNRVVALKMIHKEALADSDALPRFQREVQAIGQLSHPNVVHAYDAGPSGPNTFLAMEYVDGIDLNALVREKGRLAIDRACDYIRQAAVGLQYIHERGLIHRDIKPSNLLVTQTAGPDSPGLVKILDLGLARLRRPIDSTATGGLTAVGTVMMGTLDYMAPEQALDFHRADIRADIYSLGCTFFFLLAGRPPFEEGTMAQKLLLHQMKEPMPLEQFRRDVPLPVGQLIRRMMAKRPEDRFQTPGEVAQLLEALGAGKVLGTALVPAPARLPQAIPIAVQVLSVSRPSAIRAEVIDASPGLAPHRLLARLLPAHRKRLRLGIVGGIAAGLLAALVLWLAFSGSKISSASGPVFLADLPEKVTGEGSFWKGGKWGKDLENQMMSKGRPAPKGILMRLTPKVPNGSVQASFALENKFRQFKVSVALEDRYSQGPHSFTLRFAVTGNSQTLWESKPFTKIGDDPDQCSLDISQVDNLELIVSCTGSSPPDPGEILLGLWIDPKLTRK